MESTPELGGNPLTYSSPLIHERRQRILRETRKLIAEKGIANFGVRELSKRAGVAQGTLYNAFSSKERIVALAIKDAFDEIRMHVYYKTPADTIEGLLDRAIKINSRNLRARNYAMAVTTIYFSPTTPNDVWIILHQMGTSGITEFLRRLQADGLLEDWVIVEDIAVTFSNMTYGIIHEWSLGRISDDDYLRRIAEALLLLAISVSKGDARTTAQRYLTDIRFKGELPHFPMARWRPPKAGEERTSDNIETV
jgi:AcrR family transcriptional regulator